MRAKDLPIHVTAPAVVASEAQRCRQPSMEGLSSPQYLIYGQRLNIGCARPSLPPSRIPSNFAGRLSGHAATDIVEQSGVREARALGQGEHRLISSHDLGHDGFQLGATQLPVNRKPNLISKQTLQRPPPDPARPRHVFDSLKIRGSGPHDPKRGRHRRMLRRKTVAGAARNDVERGDVSQLTGRGSSAE